MSGTRRLFRNLLRAPVSLVIVVMYPILRAFDRLMNGPLPKAADDE